MNELYARIEAEIENYENLKTLAKECDHSSAERDAQISIDTLKGVLELIRKMN